MAEVQSCPDVNCLQRLLDGLLTEQEQGALNEHLADCSACQERLDGLIAGQGMWSDVARNLKSAHVEIEAGTATRYAPRPGEALDHADDDLTLEFLANSDKPESLGRLGHYEVLEVIGRGGMGIVLRAFDEKLHRIVAIKVMAPRLAATSPPRKRFLREARAAAQVRHENVVDIHAVEELPIPHLVMEFVPGESLQQRLDRIGPLEVPDVLRIGQQIARGLAAAHAQGLIHRDVKPGNVLLEKGIEERVKITDFGLARAADDASMTQSGVIAGTPLYMAPEQAQGGAIDHRADLFSLGSVLYAMASGRPPFRAPTSLAVLKRVVEEAPRPIQEIIPEVPQWLCDMIAKLHAKRPEDRFQSAKEVADLLGQCLANGRPSAGADFRSPGTRSSESAGSRLEESKPFAKSKIPNPKSQIGHRHWALAAVAAVVLLFIGLSLTEATGVTQVVPTVLRIVTGEGTLVVETDPDVQVTLEGNGDLTFNLAGGQTIRVPSGSYRVRATKDGKPIPLEKDLITITRGKEQVVRVRLESAAATVVSTAQRAVFVVLDRKGAEVRKYGTLADAAQGASDGDTIEIRANGPFVSDSILIKRSLTIRAGAGFRPVIKLETAKAMDSLLAAEGPLVLEGLELRITAQGAFAVSASVPSLHVANCRFVTHDRSAIWASWLSKGKCEIRNCEFVHSGGWHAFAWGDQSETPLIFNNNLVVGGSPALGYYHRPDLHDVSVQLKGNTLICGCPLALFVQTIGVGEKEKPIQIETAGNILDASDAAFLLHVEPDDNLKEARQPHPREVEPILPNLVNWREERNLHAAPFRGAFVEPQQSLPALKSLADWQRFWKTAKADSLEGRVRYQGGDLLGKLQSSAETLTPDDFRLRPDSAGYRAGPDGKDLGADIDLVGPGEAYERWKKTPDYQEWLRETGQLKEKPAAQKQAFVVLSREGAEIGKFDSLATAVVGASDGDTIEVRSNGPLETSAIHIGPHNLTIRAGKGYRPVLRMRSDDADTSVALITSRGRLVLEGLDVQRWNQTDAAGHLVHVDRAPLYLANCRMFVKVGGGCVLCQLSDVDLRNCEFLTSTDAYQLQWGLPARGKWQMANCISTGGTIFNLEPGHDPRDLSIHFEHNTLITESDVVLLAPEAVHEFPQALPGAVKKPLGCELSGNVIDASVLLSFQQRSELLKGTKPLGADQVEALLPALFDWQEHDNVYAVSGDFAAWWLDQSRTGGLRTLADWNRFWGRSEASAKTALLRYVGGNLLARRAQSCERLTPDDFRLRPDSAGYRAGPDGKDLGADIDLVGPGPAYERWKKTPEYQEWLKETGQTK